MVQSFPKKQHLIHSVMSDINLSLLTIISITLLAILYSFWMTKQADTDAHAINLSGSMRMQTYHIGLAVTHAPEQLAHLIEKLDSTWKDPLFTAHQHINLMTNATDNPESLASIFEQAYTHWFDIVKPHLLNKASHQAARFHLLNEQVHFTDKLVNRFQHEAESKIRKLRTFQLIAMLMTTLVGSLIFYLLKHRIAIPLSRLTEAAKRIRDGETQQYIELKGKDELSLLAESFNQMSQVITETYQQLESRVELRTQELQQSNTLLEYSFNVARKVLENQDKKLDFNATILDLSKILEIEDIELCLFTKQGENPYLQLDAHTSSKTEAAADTHSSTNTTYRYPVMHHDKQYGVISLKQLSGETLLPWQQQLTQSTADQLAIALSLEETKEQEHRLAMLNERTVMARELHDSLAQSLSYLKIQVTLLQKSHDSKKYELQQPIIDELSEGLSSAYRHLRELLTTFRLKIDKSGLKGAIAQSVKQLQARTAMHINLTYHLNSVPLSPTEEIHLLQIMREASQNAVNHSKGSQLNISLEQLTDKRIQLIIQDDGIGLGSQPGKLNHYGLAIIQERSHQLQAEVIITSVQDGIKGTRIELIFRPFYLAETTS